MVYKLNICAPVFFLFFCLSVYLQQGACLSRRSSPRSLQRQDPVVTIFLPPAPISWSWILNHKSVSAFNLGSPLLSFWFGWPPKSGRLILRVWSSAVVVRIAIGRAVKILGIMCVGISGLGPTREVHCFIFFDLFQTLRYRRLSWSCAKEKGTSAKSRRPPSGCYCLLCECTKLVSGLAPFLHLSDRHCMRFSPHFCTQSTDRRRHFLSENGPLLVFTRFSFYTRQF